VPTPIEERVAAIKALLEAFKYERIVYLAVTILSLIVLFVCGISLLLKGESITSVIGMFTSTGAITFTAGRVLSMWNEALRVVSGQSKEVAP